MNQTDFDDRKHIHDKMGCALEPQMCHNYYWPWKFAAGEE
jgi:hypothetical protein